MQKSITRCPKCHTAFRVTNAHLNSAKGAVRCGSCLNIFNAKDFLVEPQPKKMSENTQVEPKQAPERERDPSASGNPKKEAAPKKTDFYEHENILISDNPDYDDGSLEDDGAFLDFSENSPLNSAPSSSEFNLFERKELPKEEEEVLETDESWALDLLRDDKPAIEPSNEASQTQKASKKVKPVPAYRPSNTGKFSAFTQEDNPPEPEPDPIQERPKKNLTTTQKIRAESVHTESVVSEEEIDPHFFDDPEEDQNDQQDPYIDETSDGDSFYSDPAYSSSQNNFLDAIEPEPVEFSWMKHGTSIWYSNTFWLSLSILSFLMAISQFAYYKFDSLSRIDPYREYYSLSCKMLGCKLPSLVDLSKIRTANLVIRSHPRISGELLVDAVLQNHAKFNQAFPSLDLIFTDINNQPIAAKRFTPQEYLAGELAGRKIMPSLQPIHIALQIKDPGPKAVNYQMSISQAKK